MSAATGQPSPHAAKRPAAVGILSRPPAAPQMVRIGRAAAAAVLTIMRYVARTTGLEASQQEVAAVLTSYFTLEEVTNQIAYLRKKPPDGGEEEPASPGPTASMRINLISPPRRNALARAGFFIAPVADGLAAIRKHAGVVLGAQPGEEELARSLMSSFILSELKNQIVHTRKRPRKGGR